MRSPCAECPDRGDYDSDRCRRCARRWNYVMAFEGATHSVPEHLADFGAGLSAPRPARLTPGEADAEIRRRARAPMAETRVETSETKVCRRAECRHGGKPQALERFPNKIGGGVKDICRDCMGERMRAGKLRAEAEKRAAAQAPPAAETAPAPDAAPAVITPDDAMLSALFGGLPEWWMKSFRVLADEEFRTPKGHLLWLVKRELDTHGRRPA